MKAIDVQTFLNYFKPLALLALVGLLPLAVVSAESIDRLLQLPSAQQLPPRSILLAATMLQPMLFALMMAAAGAGLAHRFGLVSIMAHERPDLWPKAWLPAILGGVAIGLVFWAADSLYFRPLRPEFFAATEAVAPSPPIALALGVLYGGLTEEITMRWGLMSLLCWGGMRWFGRGASALTPTVAWAAILIAALIFALGHLPATLAMGPADGLLLLRMLLLNGLAGIAFGWLFWRHTLEAAMLAHGLVHVTLFVARGLPQ